MLEPPPGSQPGDQRAYQLLSASTVSSPCGASLETAPAPPSHTHLVTLQAGIIPIVIVFLSHHAAAAHAPGAVPATIIVAPSASAAPRAGADLAALLQGDGEDGVGAAGPVKKIFKGTLKSDEGEEGACAWEEKGKMPRDDCDLSVGAAAPAKWKAKARKSVRRWGGGLGDVAWCGGGAPCKAASLLLARLPFTRLTGEDPFTKEAAMPIEALSATLRCMLHPRANRSKGTCDITGLTGSHCRCHNPGLTEVMKANAYTGH
eukprot:1157043-Pelagomonas_calceolata.AAC.7